MIENPKSLTDQLSNLTKRMAIEMRALNRTKVSKVNGVVPDSNGNVAITSVDSATKATNDGSGNVITSTYATKSELTSGLSGKVSTSGTAAKATADASGNVITSTYATKAEVNSRVKSVNSVEPDSNGNVNITSVDSATKATQDASGNVITSTYATKTELSSKANSSHTHAISDVTNLQSSLNAKLATSTYNTDKATFALKSELNAIDVGVTSINGQTGDVTIEAGGLSPSGGTFTGTTVIYPATDTEEAVTGTVFNAADNKSVVSIGSATELTDAEGTPIGGQVHLHGSEQGGTAMLIGGSPDGIAGLIADPAGGFQLIAIGENGYGILEVPLNKVPNCLGGNFVTSVNGVKADDYGNVTIEAGGSSYTLPNATSTTLGGVKIGNNITVSSGTISLTKSNVTSALGYTPVTSVNGKTGAVTIESGVAVSGSRGSLAGYETSGTNTTINASAPDSNETGSNITVSNGSSGTSWTKVVRVTSTVNITLGTKWSWSGGEVPVIVSGGILVCCWCGTGGVASFVSPV